MKSSLNSPGMSIRSSKLGCSGVKPGWIISALLVYTETTGVKYTVRMCVFNTALFGAFILLKFLVLGCGVLPEYIL